MGVGKVRYVHFLGPGFDISMTKTQWNHIIYNPHQEGTSGSERKHC